MDNSMYNKMLAKHGSRVGGEEMINTEAARSQGHRELPPSNRSPLNPGQSSRFDKPGPASMIGESHGNHGKK